MRNFLIFVLCCLLSNHSSAYGEEDSKHSIETDYKECECDVFKVEPLVEFVVLGQLAGMGAALVLVGISYGAFHLLKCCGSAVYQSIPETGTELENVV